MSLSLHAAFVPSCQQILASMSGLVDKAEAFARDQGYDDAELIDARLAEDMWSLPWHVRACWMHSTYVIDQIAEGEFTPDFTELPDGWDGMRAMIADAQAGLKATTPEQLEAVSEKTIGFILGGKRLMELTGANFLLSFSQPNFYFHATTFYGILRMKGLPLKKMEFLGPVRVLGS